MAERPVWREQWERAAERNVLGKVSKARLHGTWYVIIRSLYLNSNIKEMSWRVSSRAVTEFI